MQSFRNLKVWRKSHELVLATYRVTARFPSNERYGLTSQTRRAGASIPANIAEGCARNGDIEFARFLQIAMGSASELEYHFILEYDLGYLSNQDYQMLNGMVTEVKQMLTAFIQRLRAAN